MDASVRRGQGKKWDEKLYLRDESVDGKNIHVVGLFFCR